MLKLIYTETGLHIEQVNAPLESLVAQRVVLAMRAGQSLCVQTGRASFLIPARAQGLILLEHALGNADLHDKLHDISLTVVDAEFLEVGVTGSWLTVDRDDEEGIFLTETAEAIEYLLHDLWQATQSPAYLYLGH
ncbi:MAG: hypothetical protein HC771_11835 [Synechococcales cyanobacterium CRU_2_2]|nr:hypothetical protein [Synechococcales cyanobacterium CRU_2_2]